MLTRCLGCMQEYESSLGVCPYCGYMPGTPAEEAIHMSPGTRLHDRYTIGKVLGFGGFGVTYIAWDDKLEQRVAIKEYLPGEFSTRMPGHSQISVFSGDKAQQFSDGMHQFVEEARRLAHFQNEPGIVTVYDSFEENNTAYIVMEYLEGETLTDYLARVGKIQEDEAVEMLLPLMNSLQAVHEAGILHRDIAPDNIFLTNDGQVKLIDFGAARYATTSHSRSLTVIIKPGYSPEEQYRSRGDQGPHTDVYALGATLYKMITSVTPPDAMERRAKYETQNKDILVPPQKYAKGLSLARRNAILNAMNVRIEDRTPDVGTFVKELNADPPAKRIYGKIKKIDVYAWPLWLKIVLPVLGVALLTMGTLMLTGVIRFDSRYTEVIVMPDNTVKVPDVEGLSTAEAIRLIENGKLTARADGNVQSEYAAAGVIVLQEPAAGAYAPVNSPVSVVVSAGTGVIPPFNGIATVPYVIWDTLEDAQAKLAEAGLGKAAIVEQYDENVGKGQVISIDHQAGEELPEGSVLTVTVSKGPETFVLRDLRGMTEEEAKTVLESDGLVVALSYTYAIVPKGQVISQDTPEGTMVHKGDTVALTVSIGNTGYQVGDIITFGNYKGSPIEWQVLAMDGGKVLVISKNGLDAKPYNTEYADVTWETCTLRSWLNNNFYNNAFSSAEKGKIQTTTVINEDNPDYGTEGGNNTKDRVFLLNIQEARTYFGSDSARICYLTQYAKSRGCYTGPDGACMWWLRSPGSSSDYAAYVYGDGYVFSFGCYVRSVNTAVRPALWINP